MTRQSSHSTPKSEIPRRNKKRFSHLFLAALLPLTLVACAPDAWKPDSPFDAFLGQVRTKCWDDAIGVTSIGRLMPTPYQVDSYFMDLSSRFFNGEISEEGYISALVGLYEAKPDSPGIRCILRQMPASGSQPPSMLPPVIK